MCCALPSCVQGLAELGSPRLGKKESQWSCFWVMVLLLSIWVCFLLGRTWLDIRRNRCHSGRRPSCLAVHPLSRGPARWVGGQRWQLSRRCRFPKRCSMPFPWVFFRVKKTMFFFKNMGYCWIYWYLRGSPRLAMMMYIRQVLLSGHFGETRADPL